ncbi:glycoside hydrolase family 20 protein [Flavihumibacter sp.]|uniref:glycoside hydrolase family 20 protein n=1 Tax=Flavihumibacter sp. TaxID=1913981 RepID=UPI002FC7B41B
MMKIYACLLALAITLANSLSAQNYSIVPEPVSFTVSKTAGSFTVNSSTKINNMGSGLEHSANFLAAYVQKLYGTKLDTIRGGNIADITLYNLFNKEPRAGAYELQVNSKGIFIGGDDAEGVFHGVQTLLQLLAQNKKDAAFALPFMTIRDYPRFAYRSMHLDEGRHFFGMDFVKKYIDYLAMHKMNYFHWHLTEDQGWRIEIKKYPRLTEVGGFRNGTIIGRYPGTGNDNLRYGGFYTQDQIREIVKYAESRHITIIPEIELPGHASAAIAAYPELSCFPEEATYKYFPKESVWAGDTTGKQVIQGWGVYDDVFVPSENTFKFLEDVFDEVLALFPSKYIHIGGDESPKTNWKRSAFCQQLIKEKGLKDEHELQSYFIQRVEKFLNAKGRTIIGWDEILEGGLAPNAVVMSWRGEEGGIAAAKENHKVIMTPGNYVYLDHSQTRNEDSVTFSAYTPIEETYSYDPLPAELPADKHSYIWGAQGNVWTEYMKNPSKVEYMIFPRLSALSEVLWSPKEKRSWDAFEKKIPFLIDLYKLIGTNYSKAYFETAATVEPSANHDGLLVKLESPLAEAISIYTHEIPGTTTIHRSNYKQAFKINGSSKVTYWTELDGNPMSSKVTLDFSVNKATGKKISLANAPSKSYPGQGGAFGLVNGLRSAKGMNSVEWLGFNGDDLDATIDLGKITTISSVELHILESPGSWIYAPQNLELLVSKDGKNFKSVGTTQTFDKKELSMGSMTINTGKQQARYIRLKARNQGVIADGKAGAGHKAWLFADEIIVR